MEIKKIDIDIKTDNSNQIRLFAEVALLVDQQSFQSEFVNFRYRLNKMSFFDGKPKEYQEFPINYDCFTDWLERYLGWDRTKDDHELIETNLNRFSLYCKNFSKRSSEDELNNPCLIKQIRQIETPYIFYLYINEIRKKLKRPIKFLNIIAKAIVCEKVKEKDFNKITLKREGRLINLADYYLEPNLNEKELKIEFYNHTSNKEIIGLKNQAIKDYEDKTLGYVLPIIDAKMVNIKKNRDYYWMKKVYKNNYREIYEYGFKNGWELDDYKGNYHQINSAVDQAVKTYEKFLDA